MAAFHFEFAILRYVCYIVATLCTKVIGQIIQLHKPAGCKAILLTLDTLLLTTIRH